MEDLKIVFYIAVAIVWVVYNNYRKIKQESQKRDYTKPPPEVITENWPAEPPVTRKPKPSPQQPIPRPVVIERKEPIYRPPLTKREPLRATRTARPQQRERTEKMYNEGGTVKPSKLVQFEEPVGVEEQENLLLWEIKNSDFKQAVILSEILKRPYN